MSNLAYKIATAKTLREVFSLDLFCPIHELEDKKAFKKLPRKGRGFSEEELRIPFKEASEAIRSYEQAAFPEKIIAPIACEARKGNMESSGFHADGIATRRVYVCSNVNPTLVVPHRITLEILDSNGFSDVLDEPLENLSSFNKEIPITAHYAAKLPNGTKVFRELQSHAVPVPISTVVLFSGCTIHAAQEKMANNRTFLRSMHY